MKINYEATEDKYSAEAKRIFNLPCSVEEVKEKYPKEREQIKMRMYKEIYETQMVFKDNLFKK